MRLSINEPASDQGHRNHKHQEDDRNCSPGAEQVLFDTLFVNCEHHYICCFAGATAIWEDSLYSVENLKGSDHRDGDHEDSGRP